MTPRPRHPKPDSNQPDIVEALRGRGFCVIDVSKLGGSALDLFVGGWSNALGYCWLQVEVKAQEGTITNGEYEHMERWSFLPIIVARSTEDVLAWFGRVE